MSVREWVFAELDRRIMLAKGATSGPWRYGTVDSVAGGSLYDRDVMIGSLDWDDEPGDRRIRRDRTVEEADANGAHIEACSPERMAALYEWMLAEARQHGVEASEQIPGSCACYMGCATSRPLANVGTQKKPVWECPFLLGLATALGYDE